MKSEIRNPKSEMGGALRLGPVGFWRKLLCIGSDDRAMAITEFVIMAPLALLAFMAIIQMLLVAQAAQLGNYAAYCAARVYAVRVDMGGADGGADKAKTYAKKAAAMAYAPVSKLVPGEIMMNGFPDISSLISGDLGIFGDVVDLADGYVMAYYLRLASGGGGDVTIGKAGSPEQVNVSLKYAFPLYLPGLAYIWKATRGSDRNIVKDFKTDLAAWNMTEFGVMNFVSPYPYVKILSKSSCGNEPWSGIVRLPATTSANSINDPAMQERQQEMQRAQEDLEAAQQQESQQYSEYCSAKSAAKTACDAAAADPDDEDKQINCSNKTATRDAEYQQYLDARAARESACENLRTVSGQSGLECGGPPGDCT